VEEEGTKRKEEAEGGKMKEEEGGTTWSLASRAGESDES